MGMLKFEADHKLSLDEAKKRVEALLAYWGKKYGVNSTWTGHSATMKGKVMGVSIDGNLQVVAAKVTGEASDPGMLFRGQAQKYMVKKFADYLDPNKTLDDIIKADV